jgi:hypothetical protein
MHTCSRLSIEASFLGELIDRPTIVAGKALNAYGKRVQSNSRHTAKHIGDVGFVPTIGHRAPAHSVSCCVGAFLRMRGGSQDRQIKQECCAV